MATEYEWEYLQPSLSILITSFFPLQTEDKTIQRRPEVQDT